MQQTQQIILSGVGGQGILFATRLLAETAIELGFSALISETHGMAQRGGNVISHLKVSNRTSAGPGLCGDRFTSPLIRPGHADILLALHPEGEAAHGYFLKAGGTIIANRPGISGPSCVDGDGIALGLGSPVSANLVLLGFAVARNVLFCSSEQLRSTLTRLGGKRLEASLRAFQAGCEAAGPFTEPSKAQSGDQSLAP